MMGPGGPMMPPPGPFGPPPPGMSGPNPNGPPQMMQPVSIKLEFIKFPINIKILLEVIFIYLGYF